MPAASAKIRAAPHLDHIAKVGEDDQAVEKVVAVGPFSGDVKVEVDLGGGATADDFFPRAAVSFPG
jgi:hypothetical protein